MMHKIIDFFDNNRIAAVLLIVLLILVAWFLYKKYTHESFCSVKSHDEIAVDKFIDMYVKPRKQINLKCEITTNPINPEKEYYLSFFDPTYFKTQMYDCDGIALVLMEKNDVDITNKEIDSTYDKMILECTKNKVTETVTNIGEIREECKNIFNKTKIYPSEFIFTLNPQDPYESDDDSKKFMVTGQLDKILQSEKNNIETNEVARIPVAINFTENKGNFLCGASKPTENFGFEIVPVSLNGSVKFRLKIRLPNPDRVAYVGYSDDIFTVDGGTDYQGINTNTIKRVVLCNDGDPNILNFSPAST